ncbi:MAG: hypothetical protein SNJ57_06140 [Cyanobacteriota bacterium]
MARCRHDSRKKSIVLDEWRSPKRSVLWAARVLQAAIDALQ